MTERDLVINCKKAKEELDRLSQLQDEAKKRFDDAEMKMIDYLQSTGADASARYDGVGHISLSKPRVFASCLKQNEQDIKDQLRKAGRGDLIREVVHPASLSSYVGELLELGKAIPPGINYHLQTKIRIY